GGVGDIDPWDNLMGNGDKFMLSVDPPPSLPSISTSNSSVPSPLRSPSPPRDPYQRDPLQAYRAAPPPPKSKSISISGPGAIIQSQRAAPPPPPPSVQHSLSQGGNVPQAI